MTLSQLRGLSDDAFINLSKSTGDFLDNNYSHLEIIPFPNQSVWNEVSTTMGVQPNRIFMGKKSIRNEMYKLHTWVRNNETLLMNLRLQAWYGIGYKTWYKQRPSETVNTSLTKFVDTLNIKTRKIFDVDETGYKTEQPNFENYESFCDVTLLADKNDLNMNNSCFIGVQNRRTDPNIYFCEDPNDKHILFLSSYEYDSLSQHGGKNPTRSNSPIYQASVWQNYFHKSFGCREITIPFNYCDPDNPNDYVLLRVQELKADENYDESWPWWRQERFKNYIDTVIGQNSSLAVKFLPGEGKMFKVDILRPEKIDGSLANSNQSKLISFPEL
ncbi:hypothetical protein, partial [Flavobacterium sp.]|uniref:hypothetical protein n=1 Tax=Flavobacterium sp. TaxID=239 RepID=UPI0025F8B371